MLQRLLEGNTRYVTGGRTYPNQSYERRMQVAAAPRPYAVVLGCADSRVPPEIIFDQGLGDLFVVRVAGTVVDGAVTGSIEFAVRELGVPLILVLGHTRCNALRLTLDALQGGAPPPGALAALVEALRPAAERARDRLGDRIEDAVRANVELGVARLAASEPVLAAALRAGTLAVAGGVYNVENGLVEVIASADAASLPPAATVPP